MTAAHGPNSIFQPCDCAPDCSLPGSWICPGCAEARSDRKAVRHERRRQRLLHKSRRRRGRKTAKGRGKGRWERVWKRRSRMACPGRSCFNAAWLRHYTQIPRHHRHDRDPFPIGHPDAWYFCLSCKNNIQIPPVEDQRANNIYHNGDRAGTLR